MITSVFAGFVVAKMKRPKLLPLASCLVCAAAFVLLAGITVGTTLVVMGAYLFILGFGAGLGATGACACCSERVLGFDTPVHRDFRAAALREEQAAISQQRLKARSLRACRG